MIVPWPCMSRGTEWTVPIVPGLVRVIVVSAKSSTVSLPARALRTMSSYAVQNSRKSISSARLIEGTRSCRLPSGFLMSMARPRLTCSRLDERRLAVDLGVGVVHLRHRLDRLDHGVADDVRERDLAATPAGQVVVDDDAVVDEELRRDRPHARGGRHREARLHVRHRAGGRAAQPLLLRALGHGAPWPPSWRRARAPPSPGPARPERFPRGPARWPWRRSRRRCSPEWPWRAWHRRRNQRRSSTMPGLPTRDLLGTSGTAHRQATRSAQSWPAGLSATTQTTRRKSPSSADRRWIGRPVQGYSPRQGACAQQRDRDVGTLTGR